MNAAAPIRIGPHGVALAEHLRDERDEREAIQFEGSTAAARHVHDEADPSPRFRAAAELLTDPDPVTIVEGIAFADRVTVLASESGAGKTFVLLALAAAVSAGLRWCGRAVAAGSVAYLSFEGDALGLRLRALRQVQGHALEHVYVLRASEPLSPLVDRDRVEQPSLGERRAAAALVDLSEQLARAGRPPIVLVAIETVRASLAGSEDSSEHVSAYLRAAKRLPAPGAALILSHHSGWQDGDTKRPRERGSSAFRGNTDAVLYLERTDYDPVRGEARLTLQALKVRDVERPAPLALIRRRVDLGALDAHGHALTSCVIEPDARTAIDRAADEAAKIEIDHHAADLQLLRLVSSRPDLATSTDNLRAALAVMKKHVEESIGRLLLAGDLARPEKQRQPYTLTAAGRRRLTAEAPTS